MTKEKTRQELIDYISENNGYTSETTKQFTTEELRSAHNSNIGAYRYLQALAVSKNDKDKGLEDDSKD